MHVQDQVLSHLRRHTGAAFCANDIREELVAPSIRDVVAALYALEQEGLVYGRVNDSRRVHAIQWTAQPQREAEAA